jgi:4-amino-4-deoxy-L-arabinose transferase-like glycosyltransferase
VTEILRADTPLRRGRSRVPWRAMPSPLAALLGAVLLLGMTWALVVPGFQAPDEQSHAGYVQSIVAGPGLPGKAGRPAFSTEQFDAQSAANTDQTAANLLGRPTWAASAWEHWRQEDAGLPRSARSDGGGTNPASSNPPLFYLYDAIPYAATSSGNFFARITAMRLAAVLWLLVTVAGAWLLAGEVFARDRLLQLVAAGVAGLMPMSTFVSSQIGPDTMLYALWSLALWLGVRIVKRGIDPASAIALLGVTGLAILTKATSYALVPAALLAVGIGLWRIRSERRRTIRLGLAAIGALAVPVLAWVVVARALDHAVAAQVSGGSTGGGTNWGQLLSYLWQFYLPRLPFMSPFTLSGGGNPAFHIWIEQGWAAFGWLEVRFPHPLYLIFFAITAIVGVAAIAQLVVHRRAVDLAAAAFLALAAVVLLVGLHWTDYHQLVSGAGTFMQGRYILPLIALFGLAVAQALSWLRGGARLAGAGVVLGGLFALELFSLGLVLTRFYA